MSDSCEHEDIEVGEGSPAEDVDDASAPFGPIVQRGRCSRCGSLLERHLRVSGWAPWRPLDG